MKKNILITGSTDGIGKEAAFLLARDGHQVYLHGRNAEKLSQVVEEVKQKTKNEQIKGFVADFSNLDSVLEMAKKVKAELVSLEVLINNAGVFNSPQASNQAGLDMRMVVNYLAPYLLTRELIPILEMGSDKRLINLSSAAQAPVSHQVLKGQQIVSNRDSYAQSKLALTMWSFFLAKKNPEVNVIALNPGSLLNTKMVREAFGSFWAPADKGAKIIYELASAEKYQGISGKYYDNDKGGFGEAHPDAYDEEKIKKLMQVTEELFSS